MAGCAATPPLQAHLHHPPIGGAGVAGLGRWRALSCVTARVALIEWLGRPGRVGLRWLFGLLGTVLVCSGWPAVARAALATQDFTAAASLPSTPVVVGYFQRVPVTVDFGQSFFSVSRVIVHARFAGDLWDPGEKFSVFFPGLFGDVGVGIANASSESRNEITLDLGGLGSEQLLNGISTFWVEADNGSFELESVSVEVQATPLPTGRDVAASIDSAAEAGTLMGVGPGDSGPGRLQALRSVVASVRVGAPGERHLAFCTKVGWAMQRLDGNPVPPDFAEGPAVPEITALLASLRRQLGCDVVTWRFSAEVTSVSGQADSPFSVGQVWDGSLSFEPTTPDAQPNASIGTYQEAILGARLWNSDRSVTLLPIRREGTEVDVFTQPLFVYDNVDMAINQALTMVESADGDARFASTDMLLSLKDRDGLVLESDQLPRVPAPIDEWDTRGLSLDLTLGQGSTHIQLLLTAISADSSP